MTAPFLRRFEKLEHANSAAASKRVKICRRFERLEIRDRRVEVAITDTLSPQEQAAATVAYIRLCPRCGAENGAGTAACRQCGKPLSGGASSAYKGQEHLLKRCACGALNLKERRYCWVCGRDFLLWGDETSAAKRDNVVELTVDGKTYCSTDRNLPSGVVTLMERIRKEGYSKELVDEWARSGDQLAGLRREEHMERLKSLQFQIYCWVGALILAVALIIVRSSIP